MRTLTRYMLALSLSLVARVADADDKKPAATTIACTAQVNATVDKAFPGSKITRCKTETEHGREQVEVKLVRKAGDEIEIDVTPDGKLLQIEEKIAIDQLPLAVAKAFTAKYPKAKADRAEKQTVMAKGVFFEIGFKVDGKTKEATFAEAGRFIDEE